MEFICVRCGQVKDVSEAAVDMVDGSECKDCASTPERDQHVGPMVPHAEKCDHKLTSPHVCSCALVTISQQEGKIASLENELDEATREIKRLLVFERGLVGGKHGETEPEEAA